jgi:hypothetical protein
MDPHKRSATIEIINDREKILAQGRFTTDRDGYRTMLKLGRQHKDRVWAVEGCNGIGRHIAQRLVADGETVVDVPAKLSARARVFDTGQGRKTDPVDAHSVAVAALRTKGLRQVTVDDVTVALRLLAALICHDRRLRPLCTAIGERHLAVTTEQEPAFRRALQALGYALPIR